MPAIITHHIFGEDVLRTLPAGMVEGEEEVLAFLLGNQGPDPLFARFSTAPSGAVRCRRLGHAMHNGRVVEAAFAMRDGVSHLPVADERVGRAFALGALGHYALDRTAHPFVFAQQEALAAAEPSLAGAGSELHAVIESDIDSWILWEKRRATVLDRPAVDNPCAPSASTAWRERCSARWPTPPLAWSLPPRSTPGARPTTSLSTAS